MCIRDSCFVLAVLASPFKSKLRLEAENAVLRHQLIVLRRKRQNVTWIWNPAGIPCGLPWVCHRSALLAQQNLNRRHQAGSRSFPSPWSSASFHQRFPKSLPTMSYNSSPVFRSPAWSIGRPLPQQPPIQQKSLPPFDKSLLSPASEKSFSRVQSRTFHHLSLIHIS